MARRWPAKLLGLGAALLGLAGAAAGQGQGIFTNATCQNAFSWMDNSLGQSPCLVAAYLTGACDGGVSSIFALPSGGGASYNAPTGNAVNPCICSTVTYSLISACGACQGSSFIQWKSWSVGCTSQVYVTAFPEAIPQNTTVPAWAYLNVTGANNFDVSAAQAKGDSPESTPAAGPATSTSTGTSSTSTATSTNPPSHHSSHAGAIAGGVVGGLAGLALVALALWYALRRNGRNGYSRRGRRRDAEKMSLASSAPTAVNSDAHGMMARGAGIGTMGGAGAALKLYNPDDPSTFPPAIPGTGLVNDYTARPQHERTLSDDPSLTTAASPPPGDISTGTHVGDFSGAAEL